MSQPLYGIKELHEEAICVRFLKAYSAANRASIQFRKLQVPRRPDCLCSRGLEVELVGVYYSREAAKQRFELARGKQVGTTSPLLAEPDETIFERIDAAIQSKSSKTYMANWDLWLTIHVDAPVLEWKDLEDGFLNQPRAVSIGPFDQIWVLLSDIDGDHISRVEFLHGHRFGWARSVIMPIVRWIRRRLSDFRSSTSRTLERPIENRRITRGGAHARIRTGDLFLTKEMLYRLSYVGAP
jgi:hypothetical protein